MHAVPAPTSPLTFRHSRNSTLNAGTSFSLTCIITPSTTGVDTEYIVQSIFTGPGISDTDRVSVSQPVSIGGNTFEITVMFNHLLEADAGTYSCSAFITSSPSQPNVIVSDTASGSESITIGRKCLGTDTMSADLTSYSFSSPSSYCVYLPQHRNSFRWSEYHNLHRYC